MFVNLGTKCQVSSTILTSFTQGGGGNTPKKPTLIRVNRDLVLRITVF